MCSLEARAPLKNFGMRYFPTDGYDLKGGRKEVVCRKVNRNTRRSFPLRDKLGAKIRRRSNPPCTSHSARLRFIS